MQQGRHSLLQRCASLCSKCENLIFQVNKKNTIWLVLKLVDNPLSQTTDNGFFEKYNIPEFSQSGLRYV